MQQRGHTNIQIVAELGLNWELVVGRQRSDHLRQPCPPHWPKNSMILKISVLQLTCSEYIKVPADKQEQSLYEPPHGWMWCSPLTTRSLESHMLTHSRYWSINNQRAKEFLWGRSWDKMSFVNLMNKLISLSKLMRVTEWSSELASLLNFMDDVMR